MHGEYYTELYENDLNVFHLIFAIVKSEAGSYFNPFTIYFIEIHYKEVFGSSNYNIIENIKKHVCLQSRIYFNQIINKEDFISNDEIIKEKIVRLNNPKDINYKKNSFLNIGLPILEENHFSPKYSIYKVGQNLEIKIELPGNINVDILKPKLIDNTTQIIIQGNKCRDKEEKAKFDIIKDIRNYGEFETIINIDRENYVINPDIQNMNLKMVYYL